MFSIYEERIRKLTDWKNYSQATKEAHALIASDPEDARSYSLLARIYADKEDFPAAVHFSKEALRKDPEDFTGHLILVMALFNLGEWKAFDAAAESALHLYPDTAHLYYLKAMRALQKNKGKKALGLMEIALVHETEDATYLAAYSNLLLLFGKKKKSKEYEQMALKSNEDNPYVYYTLANTAFNRGDFKQARELSRSAAAIDPDDQDYREQYLEMLKTDYALYRFLLRILQTHSFIRRKAGILFWPVFLFFFIVFNPLFWLYVIVILVPYYFSNYTAGKLVSRRLGYKKAKPEINKGKAIAAAMFAALVLTGLFAAIFR
ncbi:tetratricopeptide repeat protein [Metabacillus sp. cB07]|uniref:tetratricopeptide repeat protein n=1 Tax=Metabacillus sp. cB07 TaxID=2806989 RepID=UPI0019397C42|nr:tetratricopeptide repeat protein [Metabacillus sp. cB07]